MQNCLSGGSSGFAAFDAVVIAASLGGPEKLGTLLRALPASFPAPILLVQHLNQTCGWLPRQLSSGSALPAKFVESGEPLLPGRVYVAPSDHHFLIGVDRTAILDRGPKVKFCRPAAELLFTSAAATYRERTLGVVLTGCNTDGTIGAQSIRWMGGRVLAQEPSTCRAAAMPRAAIRSGAVDFVLPVEKISAALVALVMVPGMADYLKVHHKAA